MPKVTGKVINSSVIADGSMYVTIKTNGKLPPKDETVSIKWGKKRTNDQNALYWLWLTWVIENGGNNEGYFGTEELHEALAGRFLMYKKDAPGGFKTYARKSTTELDKVAFGEYFEKCQQCAREYLNIDDSSFWKDYLEVYGEGK